MAIKINVKGRPFAEELIATGAIDRSSSWSFSASDGNKLLGKDNDWTTYGKFHLAIDDEYESDTKQHYKYPFGKNDKLFRSALIAIRQRSGQQKEEAIFAAAGDMLAKIDEDESKSLRGGLMMERRCMDSIFEIREATEDKQETRFSGYAAKFNVLSEEMCGWYERIAIGAFAESIISDDIRALWNHDSKYVLGRVKNKTLSLQEDSIGLRFEVIVPKTQWAHDLTESIRRGDVSQMSFGFGTLEDSWEAEQGQIIRTLRKAKVYEVSPVTFPAYPATEVALRSKQRWDETQNTHKQMEAVKKGLLQKRFSLRSKALKGGI